MPSNTGPSPIMSLSSCICDLAAESSHSDELLWPCRYAKPAGAALKRGCGEAELPVAGLPWDHGSELGSSSFQPPLHFHIVEGSFHILGFTFILDDVELDMQAYDFLMFQKSSVGKELR